MTEDLWAAEQEITEIFRGLIEEVGLDRADLMFDEAGLNDDYPEDEKLKLAREIADA